jgi:hypothetical protein
MVEAFQKPKLAEGGVGDDFSLLLPKQQTGTGSSGEDCSFTL